MDQEPEFAPSVQFPLSQNVVNVSVINSTAHIRCPLGFFVEAPLPGHETLDCPAYVFLVENSEGKKALFDLGVRTDKESFPPVIRSGLAGLQMDVEKDIATILREDGRILPGEIDSIILSHWHADHIGDPSTFPSHVELVVGPGFRDAFLPGYPADPNAVILESDYAGRQLREIDFVPGLEIGGFRAMDFFGDGSFYLLDSPGHAIGHMCGLARTTSSTFIFMGADGCHHCGSLRPNNSLPLPSEVSPSPFSVPPHLQGTTCPGSVLEAIHPRNSRTEPYYSRLAPAPSRDVPVAETTLGKMMLFDGNEDVFVIIAHDRSLLDVIDFFPSRVNEWKRKGWKEAGRWRFLEDFKDAVARDSI
ncbi:hypothetical protein ASPVEDRAFT_128900 [Aspergillus versicolor CBS 583.65]|uniref:Metallo-beta-lactamase domain-containing protein n=1 Tax=Aspergillus versicolor CBS 583.65 TaxID=1036611 RepID=A0A1L9PDK8_ASPVE|nr:uncharacterized protein ASPVEDRAFT_128900 [Aspergillus versicolor CBS 583.65]OJI99599.1 hypothetical protein ASPVEDRAFT_128900 [Aspergillus versicolor CBS 583.65]